MGTAAREVVRISAVVIMILASFSVFGAPARGQITMQVFFDPHNTISGNLIGFTYAGDKFVGSVQQDGLKVLYAIDLDGRNARVFAPNASVPSGSVAAEHYVVGSFGLGGFPRYDIYVGAGTGVLHIANDGSSSDTFLQGLASPVRAMIFDLVGTFGNDMLVSTYGGEIYRVNSSGTASLLASVGEQSEGMDVVPIGAHFGRFDGQLVVASELSGLLRAVSPSGVVTVLNESQPIYYAERISFVPPDLGASGSSLEGLYVTNYPTDVLTAASSQFAAFKGDAVVTTEAYDYRVARVHWNGNTFEITVIGNLPGLGEDGVFLTPRMLNPVACSVSTSQPIVTRHTWCAPFCHKGERQLEAAKQ